MTRFITAAFAIALLCGLTPAQARRHHAPSLPPCVPAFFHFCPFQEQNIFAGVSEIKVRMYRVRRPHHLRYRDDPVPSTTESVAGITTEVVANPAGCPHTAFCGCAAAVRVFGSPVKSLWAAASWFRFPRAEPAAGMVAVRAHHVFVIEAVLDRGLVMAYDPNSGHHMTRIHARSLAGYRVVNPRG